jgi:hypothetical protein
MNTKDLASDGSSDRKAVECIDESLPNLDVAAPLTLIIESINTSDIGTFMITAEKEKVLGILELVTQEEQDCLQALFATVHIVA